MKNKFDYSESFNTFLKDKEMYKQNVSFWKSVIKSITNENQNDWILNNYDNGVEINDGNPLYSVRFDSNKAIRIIQDKRNDVTPKFASWNCSYNIEDTQIEELVIALQPYKNIYNDAIQLIENFLKNKYKRFQLDLNIKYNDITNEYRLKVIDNIINKVSSHILLHQELNQNNLHEYRKLNIYIEEIQNTSSRFQTPIITRKYDKVISNLVDLKNTITLKSQIDFEAKLSLREYKKNIIKSYSNNYNYTTSYNSKMTKLIKSYNELKRVKSNKIK